MPVPPPPPPPPPPPGPSLSSSSSSNVRSAGSTSLPLKSNDRAKLLGEIQAGMKLRKTVTNDRSAPIGGGRVGGLTENGGTTPGSGGPKIPAVGVGGLFANGIPKKPSDNKRNQANVFKGAKTSPPLLPKPSPMHSAKPIGQSESFRQQQQQPSTPVSNRTETPSIQRQTSATVANRLEQLFNQHSRPGLAPPTPPVFKPKPNVKEISQPVKKISIPEQFKTLRPNRTANDVPTLRRSGSSDDVRSTPPPPSDKRTTPPPLPVNPPSSSRIAKPACRPPPPPSQPPRVGRLPAATLQHFTPVSSSSTPPPPPPPPAPAPAPVPVPAPAPAPLASAADDDSPPPPPPPRIASCGDYMDRFTFIPINELPPPGIFSGTKKVYEYHPPRKIQNAPSAYR